MSLKNKQTKNFWQLNPMLPCLLYENCSTGTPQRPESASAEGGGVTNSRRDGSEAPQTEAETHSAVWRSFPVHHQGPVNILSTTHYEAHHAGGRLATLTKMPYARCLELEDGGVGWRGFCFGSSADQVSKAGRGYDVTSPVVGVFLSSANVCIKASPIQVRSNSSVETWLFP